MPALDPKQIKRAREETEKGLSRRDTGMAVQALLKLPPDERSSLLPKVAGLFQSAVTTAAQAGAWAQLVTWAARAEHEPRLLGEGSARDELLWRLCWGAARSKEWKRASRFWGELAPRAPPALAEAMQAFLDTEGQVPAALAAKLPLAPAQDPRLGYDSARIPVPAAPKQPEEVRQAVLQLRSAAPDRFAETIRRWSDQVPAEVRQPLWRTAAELASVELLRASAAGRLPPLAWTRLLARAAEVLPPGEVREPLLQAIRSLSASLKGELRDRDGVSAYSVLMGAAARLPELRTTIALAVASIRVDEVVLLQYWRMLEGLLPQLAPVPAALWARGWETFELVSEDGEEPSTALEEATKALLAERRSLTAWLKEPDPHQHQAAEVAVRALPAELAEALISFVAELGGPHRTFAARLAAHFVDSFFFDEEALPIDIQAMADELGIDLPTFAIEDRDEAVFRRVGIPLVQESPELLRAGLSLYRNRLPEARALARKYLEGREDQTPHWLVAIAIASNADVFEVARELEDELLDRTESNLDELARVFKASLLGGAPARFLQKVARHLRKHEDSVPPNASEDVQEALKRAKRLVSKPKPRQPRAKKPKAETAPKPSRPRAKRSKPPEGSNES